jgi:hypothetical protein
VTSGAAIDDAVGNADVLHVGIVAKFSTGPAFGNEHLRDKSQEDVLALLDAA